MPKHIRIKEVLEDYILVRMIIKGEEYQLKYDKDVDHVVDIGLGQIGIVYNRNNIGYARYHRDSVYGQSTVSRIIAEHYYPKLNIFSVKVRNGDSLDLRKSNLEIVERIHFNIDDYSNYEVIWSGFRRGKQEFTLKCKGCGRIRETNVYNLSHFPKCKPCEFDKEMIARLRQDYSILERFSNGSATIQCDKGHVFPTRDLTYFTRESNNCLRCQGKLLTIEDIEVPIGYKLLSTEYKNEHGDLEVLCDKGHIYTTTQNKLSHGYKCSYCSPSKPLTIDDKIRAIESTGYKYISGNLSSGNNECIKLSCPKGHIKEIRLDSAMYEGSGCSTCNSILKQSSQERIISAWLLEQNIDFLTNDQILIKPYELDILIPSHNLAIEINGIYYHSVEIVGKNKHRKKFQMCRDLGITLLTFFDVEIDNDLDKVKDIISIYLSGKDIYAHDVKELKVDNRFPIAIRSSGLKIVKNFPPRIVKVGGIRHLKCYDCGHSLIKILN